MADLARRGISAIIGAPFASGILATGSAGPQHYAYGKAPPEMQTRVLAMEAVCLAHGVALPAAALQFVLAHPIVVSTIPGGAHPHEVTQNAAHAQATLPPGFWADLKTEGLIDADAPVPC
jgi:D-threo-aldose 1-dehydrogenase